MIYKEILPHAQLRPYIKCYWIMEKEYAPGEQEHVFPESCFELLFQQTGRFRHDDMALPQLFFIGQLKHPIYLGGEPVIRQYCVRFWPWGLAPFSSPGTIKDKAIVPADEVLHPQSAKLLTDRLQAATDSTFVSTFDDYFLERLVSWRFDSGTVKAATEYIRLRQGAVKIKELAEYCFTSQRTLERDFSKFLAQTPKDMAAKVKFEHARNYIIRWPRTPFTQVAARFGYTDQSHLTKDFRKYAGMTPSAFAELVVSMHFDTYPDVAFLQDDEI